MGYAGFMQILRSSFHTWPRAEGVLRETTSKTRQMLRALALLGFAATCVGQLAEFPIPPYRLAVPAGEAEVSLRLEAKEALKPGDEIILSCDRSDLPIRIVLPDGTQFDRTTADEHGFDWDYLPYTAPFGKSDGGERVRIEARREHPSGIYTVTVSGRRLEAEIHGGIYHYPPPPAPEVLHEEILKLFPDARRVGPETVPGGTKDHALGIDVDKDAGDGVVFQVVVPDRTVRVTLEAPDGTVFDQTMPVREDQKWEITDGLIEDEDPDPWNLFDISKLFLPHQGTHHYIALPKISKGTHRIHLDTTASAGPIEVRVLYLPLMQVIGSMFASLVPSLEPARDRVLLSVEVPGGEVHVGDELPLKVAFHGPPVSDPVQFEVQVESRPMTSAGMPGPREFGEANVNPVAVEFRKTKEQRYEAKYVAAETGLLRFLVKARGKKTDGASFEAVSVENGPVVNTVSAKFLGITERAVDENADGYPDRLEVRAELDVAIEGQYELDVEFQDGRSPNRALIGLSLNASAHLMPGRRSLVATVRAEKLVDRLKGDGPYPASRISIWRGQGGYAADHIDTNETKLASGAYKRADWMRGSTGASRVLKWRAADRLGTGKGQMLEIDWPVVSPGGRCRWGGTFVRLTGEGRFEVPMAEAVLPEGEVTLPVDLVANRLLPFGSSVWRFEPSLQCDSSQIEVEVPIDLSPRVPFSASAFEPLQRGMLMRRLPPVRVTAGRANEVVTGFEQGTESPATTRVTVEKAPEGIDCRENSSTVGGWVIVPRLDTPPGEYEVVLGLDSAGVKSTMAIRVIVSAPEAQP